MKDFRVPSEGNCETVQTTENIPILTNRSKDNAYLLDNITMCDKLILNFDGSCDYLDMETGQYIHHLNSEIGDTDALFLVHFGAPPISGAKQFDKQCSKSLYYRDLRCKRP